jgi:hypothetical protein
MPMANGITASTVMDSRAERHVQPITNNKPPTNQKIMVNQEISSAIAYLESKAPIGFERFAEQVRMSIKAGRVKGLTFPEVKEAKPLGGNYTSLERKAMIQAAHDLRAGGMKSAEAAKATCGSHPTYRRWMAAEGMPYKGGDL